MSVRQLNRDERDVSVVYPLLEPASHYYRAMTGRSGYRLTASGTGPLPRGAHYLTAITN
jgi:hypothetical protein